MQIPKIILHSSKVIAVFSPKLATLFSAKLFTTPIKHNIPKKELDMDDKSIQTFIEIPKINKKAVAHQYGESDRKILLVHGGSGRGTQLFKIADELLKRGYSTINFDTSAHGKSSGRTTILDEFVETILEIEKPFDPFEAAIGHSLGGMSLLNSLKKDLKQTIGQLSEVGILFRIF